MDYPDEEFDLEELESRLYSQIHHSTETTQELEYFVTCDPRESAKKKYRYFENAVRDSYGLNENRSYKPVANSNEVANVSTNQESINNNIPNPNIAVSPNNTDINIRTDQNYIPVVSITPCSTFSSVENWKETFTKNKKRKKKKKKRKNKSAQSVAPVNSVVIFISDSDSNDCVAVEEQEMSPSKKVKQINTKFPKKYSEADGDKIPEVDDDVVFVPPPPVEVITVEPDEKSPQSVGELNNYPQNVINNGIPEPLPPESSLSNDFLETTNIESNSCFNFNFSLHGSDFNNGSTEFVHPSKCGEYCETESSCSTNEQNRNFSNTVKTIVFDEVEFPKEDIFSEKNLESFSSFITPKRSSSKPKEFSEKALNVQEIHSHIDVSSDTSSSESDYESSRRKIDNLPNLSPMVSYENFLEETRRKASDFFKTKSGTSKDTSNESALGIYSRNESPEDFDKSNKKHKKQFEDKRNKNLLSKSKRKKKQDPSLINNSEEDKTSEECLQSATDSTTNTEKIKKKKKKKVSSTYSCVPDNVAEQDISSSASLTGNRLLNVSTEVTEQETECLEGSTRVLSDNTEDNYLEKVKNKKKKGNSASRNLTEKTSGVSDVEDYLLTFVESGNYSQRSKKRKKKIADISVINTGECEDKCEENENFTRFVKETSDAEKRCNINLPEKSKKKKKRETSLSDKINSKDEILESNISVSESNVEDDVRLEQPGPSTRFNESVESKNKRKRSDSRCSSVIENPEKGSTENIQQLVDIKNDNFVTKAATGLQDEEQSDVTEVISNETLLTNVDNAIIIDSDDSSDSSEIVISSDSEIDFQVIEDVGNDLSLNCSEPNSTITPNFGISQEEYENIIGRARLPPTNFEQFDVASIQSQQSDDPKKWLISYKDLSTYHKPRENKGPRCNRCRHFGHISIKCPDKPRPLPCTLCGNPDHQEPRCPNKRCAQCGFEGNYTTTYCHRCFKFRHFVCRLCKMVGHLENTCPDLWRRYHLTTDRGPMVVPQEPIRSRSEQWCSGCAQQGHLEHECNYYNREFPPTTPFIMNYQDNLEHNKRIEVQNAVIPTSSGSLEHSKNSSSEISPIGGKIVNAEIPSLLSLPIPVNLPTAVNQIVIPNIIAPNLAPPNFTIQVSNDPPNVSSEQSNNEFVFEMKVNFQNSTNTDHTSEDVHKVDVCNIKEIQRVIMTMSRSMITTFLQKQIDELEHIIVDVKNIRRKMYRLDNKLGTMRHLTKKIHRERNVWNRKLNMLVFGVHKFNSGKIHIDKLKSFISQNSRLNRRKRTALFNSYWYIFGCDRHSNVDYYKILHRMYNSSNKNGVS